jgi:O-antigen/teichoic acid export membrane protein
MSTVARKLLKGSTLRTFSFIAQVAVTLFMMPFIVQTLGDRLYGFWSLVGVFIGYYGLMDFGLSTAISRYIANALGTRDSKDLNQVFNTGFVLFTALGSLVMLLTVLIAVTIPFLNIALEDKALFKYVILILGFDMAIAFPIRIFRGILTSQLRYDIMSGLQIMSLFLRSSLILLVLLSGHKVLAMALVTALSHIPEYVLTIYFAKKNLPYIKLDRGYWNRTTAKTLLSYSIFAFIANVADILRFQVDSFVIAAYLGLAAVTHYKVGSLIAVYFLNFMATFITVLLPVFSRLHGSGDHEGIRKTFFFANKIAICMASFMGFGLIFWGKHFIERWMGPDYLDAYPILAILVLGFLLALWQSPSFDFLFGTSKQKFVALINSIEGISNLILSLVLVRYLGLAGVALGTLIPMFVIKLFVQPIYVSRALSIPYSEYMRKIGKTISIVCLSLLLPSLISIQFGAPDYTILLSLGVISLSIYLFGMWLLEFSPAEILVLRGAILLKRPKQMESLSKSKELF